MSAYQGRFAGRTAVVTGGASGLGKASAARIVAEGGKVVLWDLNADALRAAADEVGAADVVALDVSDSGAVAAAAEASAKVLGKIDILIASAGITGATVPVHEFPIDSWKRVIDINLNGVFYCCRAVVPFMLENGYGRIVNVASVAGFDIRLHDIAEDRINAALATIDGNMARQVAKGAIADEDRRTAMSRIVSAPKLEDLGPCDLVIEAATESEEVKRKIFTAVCT